MIEKSYYVAPDDKNKNDKAYSLLVKVLTETKKIAVGKVVFKDKEHVVALRPYQRALVMHLLHFVDEIRPVDEISELKGLQRANLDNKELSLGKLLVENLSSDHFAKGGIGRILMDAALTQARKQNHDQIRLVQSPSHIRSLVLYTKSGFTLREPLFLMQGQPLKGANNNASSANVLLIRDDNDISVCNEFYKSVYGFSRDSS